MKPLKQILIIVVVGVLLVVLSMGVTSQDISSRAIIVGIGIDYDSATEEFVTTSEVLSPTGRDKPTVSKFVITRGQTISEAVFNVYVETGELASLGQCQIVILGEQFYQNENIKHCISYFNLLEALIDSSIVCGAAGSAYDLMQTHLPQEQSISFCLTNLLKESSSSIAVSTTTLGQFLKGQLGLSKCGHMSVVEYKWQQTPTNESEETKAKVASFDCQSIAVFKDFEFVAKAQEAAARGFSLCDNGTVGQHYTVSKSNAQVYESKLFSVAVVDKSVDTQCVEKDGKYEVTVKIEVGVQNSNRDYWGVQGREFPLIKRELSQTELDQAKVQIEADVASFVEQQKQFNFDLLGIYKGFELAYGKQWREKSKSVTMEQMEFVVEVNVYET